MQGTAGPSQFEMGMSSMVALLTNISMNTEKGNQFLDSINNKVNDIVDFVVKPFDSITKQAINFNKVMLMKISQSTNYLGSILDKVTNIFEYLQFNKGMTIANSEMNGGTVAGLNNSFVDKQINVYFNGFKIPSFKSFDKLLDKLLRIIEADPKNFEKINKNFEGFVKNLQGIEKHAWRAGVSLTMLSVGFTILSLVSLTGIVKFILVIGVLGIAIGLFLSRMTKAVSGVGIIKTWIILTKLSDLFFNLGLGVVFMAFGLKMFNDIGYGALIKLIATISLMAISFRLFSVGSNKYSEALLLMVLGGALWFFSSQLTKLNDVNWASVFKLSVFIISIGMSLNFLTKSGMLNLNNPLFILSLGLSLLVFSLIGFDDVNIVAVMQVFALIGMLGVILSIFQKKTGSIAAAGTGGTSVKGAFGLIGFAIGLGILAVAMYALSFVPVAGIIGILGFIVGLGIVLRVFNGTGKINPLTSFAFGIAILVLAMVAITEVPFEGVFKLLAFITGLGLIFKIFNFDRRVSPMTSFAFGIAILVLAMDAMAELPWWAMIKMLLFIVGLGLAIKLTGGKGPSSLVGFAFGMGILVLAMFAMGELPIHYMLLTIGFLFGLSLAMKSFTVKGILMMMGLSAGIIAISLSLKTFKNSGFGIMDALVFVGTIVMIGAVMLLMGIPAVAALIGVGVAVAIGMGISVFIIAMALKKVNKLDVNTNSIWNFMEAVSIMALGFAILAIPLILAAVGAVLFIVVGLAAILGAEAVNILSNSEYNPDMIQKFMDGIKILALGFADYAILMIPAAIGAVLFIPVAISALIGAFTIQKISSIEIDNQKINNYTKSVKLLLDGYKEYGIIALGKAAIKATALLPIFFSAYLGALALQKISKVEISKDKMQVFGDMMSYMIDTVLDSLSGNEKKLQSAKPGIEALAKLMNASKGLAEVIQMMANLSFYEYEVKDGQLVLKGVRQLTDNDFKLVGNNLGLMLSTLIKPLEMLGSNDATLKIGGYSFANPFKSRRTKKGIEMLAELGNAYKPMAESIKMLAESGVMTDPELNQRFTSSLENLIGIYVWIFDKLKDYDAGLISKSITSITQFNNGFKDIPTKEMTQLNEIFEKFVTNLTEDIKWKKIRENLTFIRKEFADIAKNINSINIEKATLFERNIRALVEKNNGQGLKEAAESLKEILGLVQERQEQVQSGGYAQNVGGQIIQSPQQSGNQVANKQLPAQQSNDSLSQLVDVMNQILASLSGVDSKLGGKLKVQVVGSGGYNQI